MYCSRAALHPELFSSSDPHASPSRNVAVTELRALWLGVMDRFAAAFSQQIDLERAEGYAPPGVPSRELATALIWASERCLYIAGLGVTDDKPSGAAASTNARRLIRRLSVCRQMLDELATPLADLCAQVHDIRHKCPPVCEASKLSTDIARMKRGSVATKWP